MLISKRFINRTIVAVVTLASLVAASAPDLAAALLTTSAANLPIPSPNPPWAPGVYPVRTPAAGTFTGTWSGVHPNWVGTYNAVGSIPTPFVTGLTTYDFTSLPLGYLPAGTYFIFSDVDGGSGNAERFDLTAYDSSGVITTPWLDGTFAMTGTGTGVSGAIVPANMPGYDWNVTNPNAYRVTGATVRGNPSIAVALVSTQDIYRMDLNKPTTHYSFALQAPVPEPHAGLLSVVTGLGMAACGRAARYRRT